jgi:hypothetical protein
VRWAIRYDSKTKKRTHVYKTTVEPGYNDVGLHNTSPTSSDILSYQFLTVNHNVTLLGYNNTRL